MDFKEPVMEITDVLSREHRKEMKRQYLADRYLYMDTIAEMLDNKNIKCSVRVVWHRELHEAIEEAVIELEPDLVIKHISASTGSINPFAMPVDRHLLRYCPAPLLIAIDPMTDDEKHIALNHKILEYSKMIAHLTENPIHTINTFETPSMMLAIGVPGFNYELIRKNNHRAHEDYSRLQIGTF
jgi:universal stress protein E